MCSGTNSQKQIREFLKRHATWPSEHTLRCEPIISFGNIEIFLVSILKFSISLPSIARFMPCPPILFCKAMYMLSPPSLRLAVSSCRLHLHLHVRAKALTIASVPKPSPPPLHICSCLCVSTSAPTFCLCQCRHHYLRLHSTSISVSLGLIERWRVRGRR